jgi:hypothetical protein
MDPTTYGRMVEQGGYATGGTVSSGALFEEPESSGCIIPLRGISQSRATDLMRTVGDAYGFTVTDASVADMLIQVTDRGQLRLLGARDDPDDGDGTAGVPARV